jgi:hypothetical protein
VKRSARKLFHKKAFVFTTALPPKRLNYARYQEINHKGILASMTFRNPTSTSPVISSLRLDLPPAKGLGRGGAVGLPWQLSRP